MDLTQFNCLINEGLAKTAHEMNSFREFEQGKLTKGYLEQVQEVIELTIKISTENPHYAEKAERLGNRYAYKLAEYYNKENSIRGRYPSVMICGGSNFSTKKKEQQNAALDNLYGVIYPKIEKMREELNQMITMRPKNEIKRGIYNAEKFGINEIKAFRVEQDAEDNRVRLYFNEKPNLEVRNILKSNGWKWSPTNVAWQRQLTANAIYCVGYISKQIEGLK